MIAPAPVRTLGQTSLGRLVAVDVRELPFRDAMLPAEVGAAKSGSGKLADRVDMILSGLEVLAVESPAGRHYA